MAKNDDRIIELKKQIEVKKRDLAANKVWFTPETNCLLDLEGIKYNLNVCTNDVLMLLMIRLHMYELSAKDLEVSSPLFCGYPTGLWITDIKNKLAVSNLKREENELEKMEAKLDRLLSEDKKTELEINEIAALLKR